MLPTLQQQQQPPSRGGGGGGGKRSAAAPASLKTAGDTVSRTSSEGRINPRPKTASTIGGARAHRAGMSSDARRDSSVSPYGQVVSDAASSTANTIAGNDGTFNGNFADGLQMKRSATNSLQLPTANGAADATGGETLGGALLRIVKGLTMEQQSQVLMLQGKAYADKGDFDPAFECYNRAISLYIDVANFVIRAQAYEKCFMWAEAYFDYSFAIRLDPGAGVLYGHRSQCLARLGKLDLAVEDMARCCALDPALPNMLNKASLLLEYGQYREALNGK